MRKNRKQIFREASKSKRRLLITKLLIRKLKVNKNGCWIFTGKLNHAGYGMLYLYVSKGKAKHIPAHRTAYKLFVGKIQPGMFICHKCDNPRCCNPKHLFQGTHADNMQDMFKKGRANITWGEKSGVHKLTTAQVNKIRSSTDSQISLAHKYGVAKSTISMIVNYKSRKYE